MIIVDKQTYSKHDSSMRIDELAALSGYKHAEGKLFAVCLESPFDILCILQYLKANSGSLLLLAGQSLRRGRTANF